MSRHFDPTESELMDRPQPVSPELEQHLAALESINRATGSHRLVRRFLARWWNPDRCYRVLDLCTGGGDLPREMVRWARARGITARIDAVDANEATLEIAKRQSEEFPEIHFVRGDALRYEPGETFDLVHCSLALHHFSNEDAVRLLQRCSELSTRWVLVSDLERHPLTTAAVYLLTALVYRDPMAVHDGRLSIRRAFSWAEMRELAETAGWENFGHRRCLICRQTIWMENRELGEIPLDPVSMPSLA
jgi:ubiquinone/menaquinone biosynthesis C-methylase UbiE